MSVLQSRSLSLLRLCPGPPVGACQEEVKGHCKAGHCLKHFSEAFKDT